MRSRGIILIGFLGLAACSRDPEKVVGGGSDQPNKIEAVGRILTVDGAPAQSAQVVSWAGDWDPQYSNGVGKAFDSSKTDSSGRWSLRVPEKGLWYVTAKTPGYRAVSKYRQEVAQLEPEARMHGTVRENKLLSLESVWVGGTSDPIQLHWKSDSSADFDHMLLPGPVRIWGKIRWPGGSDTVLLAEQVLDTGENPELVLESDTGNVLLASAESSPMRSALRGLDYNSHDLDAARWFTTTDQIWGGSSKVLPLGFPDADSAIRSDSFGRYFSWDFKLGQYSPGNIQPWAAVGLRLSKRDLDWSGLQFIRMWVRGNSNGASTVWVQINTSAVDQIGGDGQFRKLLNLPSGWSFVNIPVQEFKPAPGSKAKAMNFTWDTIKHSVHEIVFYSQYSDATLELKEIRAIGNRLQRW